MSADAPADALRLIAFWREAGRTAWFDADPTFDEALRTRFAALHRRALDGDLDDWADTADGALALVLLLDQLSRNLHRGSPSAFSGDDRARRVAEAAIGRGLDRSIATDLRPFLYLPFEHAEDPAAQERSVALNAALSAETGNEEAVRWARHHRDIVARFGRFPHRNAVLGRTSTAEERAFLAAGGFGG